MDRHAEMLRKIRVGAEHAFGTEESVRWLNRRSRIFNHRTPLEMIDEDADRVLTFVSSISSGGISESENR